jgi:hypothetical protein
MENGELNYNAVKKPKCAEKAYLVTRRFIFDQGSSWKKNQKLVTSSKT